MEGVALFWSFNFLQVKIFFLSFSALLVLLPRIRSTWQERLVRLAPWFLGLFWSLMGCGCLALALAIWHCACRGVTGLHYICGVGHCC